MPSNGEQDQSEHLAQDAEGGPEKAPVGGGGPDFTATWLYLVLYFGLPVAAPWWAMEHLYPGLHMGYTVAACVACLFMLLVLSVMGESLLEDVVKIVILGVLYYAVAAKAAPGGGKALGVYLIVRSMALGGFLASGIMFVLRAVVRAADGRAA